MGREGGWTCRSSAPAGALERSRGATPGFRCRISSRPGGSPESVFHASTHSSLIFHVVFSTKEREVWLSLDFRPRLGGVSGDVEKKRGGV